MSAQACPQSYISVGRIWPPEGSIFGPPITGKKGESYSPMNELKRAAETAGIAGYFGWSTRYPSPI